MYTCGPSIYQLPHIGNNRTFLYEDILLRYLEYLGYLVERTIFITDIEDKAIAEAEKEGTTLKELTEKNATFDKFKKACDRLHKFKKMVNKLQNIKTRAEKSNLRTKKLIAKLKKDFEGNMNNDLHVKDAFDALLRTVSKLVSLTERGKVNAAEAEGTLATLKDVDQVLQVIF